MVFAMKELIFSGSIGFNILYKNAGNNYWIYFRKSRFWKISRGLFSANRRYKFRENSNKLSRDNLYD